MSVRVRFAPSPTGQLHVGNIKAAVINWLFARAHGGEFVLRLDDTDEERSQADFAHAIERDLRWLGLDWDSFHRQSDRLERYDLAARALKEGGRLYACYETAEELETKRRLQLARGRPPVYDRAGLSLDEAERRALEAAGRKPHWRFLLSHGRIAWDDLIRGTVAFEAEALSDPVLIREDGRPLYTLSSVVDDGELAISHVLRGEDHVANTAVQIQLFEALGHAVPRFGHFALLVAEDGGPLSKRLGALTVAALRDEGIEPLAILSLLARLGSADPVEPRADHRALIDNFDVTRFGRAAARFDVAELWNLNAKVLHLLSFEAVAERLPPGVTDAVWNAVRGNLTKLADVAAWLDVINGPVEPVIEDAEFAALAREAFPDKPIDETTWPEWTAALKAATGRKGKALFMPLRLALTGRADGPELRALLPLIGRQRILRRLAGERA